MRFLIPTTTLVLFLPTIISASLGPNLDPNADNNLLEERQGVAPAGNQQITTPAATQMSPTTTYMIHGVNGQQTPVAYTQTFVAVPDQWPLPTAGTIGLGTIQGTVGVVRTNTKRHALPEPTAVLRDVEGWISRRWLGSTSTTKKTLLEKRKRKPKIGSSGGAASSVRVDRWGLAGAVVVGVAGVVVAWR